MGVCTTPLQDRQRLAAAAVQATKPRQSKWYADDMASPLCSSGACQVRSQQRACHPDSTAKDGEGVCRSVTCRVEVQVLQTLEGKNKGAHLPDSMVKTRKGVVGPLSAALARRSVRLPRPLSFHFFEVLSCAQRRQGSQAGPEVARYIMW